MALQCFGDGRCNFVLQGEDIGQGAVVALDPEAFERLGVDQFDRNPDIVATAADRSIEKMRRPENGRNLVGRFLCAAELETRRLAQDLEIVRPRDGVEDLLADAVRKIGELGIVREVVEGENRKDRLA